MVAIFNRLGGLLLSGWKSRGSNWNYCLRPAREVGNRPGIEPVTNLVLRHYSRFASVRATLVQKNKKYQ